MLGWREQERLAGPDRVWAGAPETGLTFQRVAGPGGEQRKAAGTLALTAQAKPCPDATRSPRVGPGEAPTLSKDLNRKQTESWAL